ncbi:hypothetical protein [Roseiconus lacunae]|uniref:Uncharacterized protein n=1 Tax=Roseiconus lacunae TaxID=2605694 RepID=A0ABT7PEQ6_9BACT|nr:hypothetical protein [Roseiconus lacunae]MDM4014977.1 hypothetical protein [Roseiconus lacunae]
MATITDPTSSQFGALNTNLEDGVYNDVIVQNGLFIRELRGRSGATTRSSGRASRTWKVQGDSSPQACREALLAAGDAERIADLYSYDSLNLQEVSYDNQSLDGWELTGDYSDTPLVGGSLKVNVSTTGATIKLYQSSNERVYPAYSGDPATAQPCRYFRGAIDVQPEGDRMSPRGSDIVIPTLRVNVTGRIAHEYVDSEFEYSKILARLTGTVNQSWQFQKPNGLGGFVSGSGFAPGELLFLGADGDIIADKDPLLTFSFLASPNLDSVTIGSIPNVTKKGHEVGWFSFKQMLDDIAGPTDDGAAGGNSKRSVVVVEGYHVHTVYASADWDDLALAKAPSA